MLFFFGRHLDLDTSDLGQEKISGFVTSRVEA
jgi:hypothetical protein